MGRGAIPHDQRGGDSRETVRCLKAQITAVDDDVGSDDSVPGAPAAEGAGAADAVSDALTFVGRSVSHRPQTRWELAEKLEARGFAAADAATALDRAEELDLVDDAAFARAWVGSRGLGRGYGQARLRRELRRRGVGDAEIESALGALSDRDERAAAEELARARRGSLPAGLSEETAQRRLLGYLARRGYPEEVATAAVRAALSDEPDGHDDA